ncbi:MAG: hypothetical protein ACI38O_03955 [Fibrobacter intestinalis]|uniref:hypothetical protein n=1 Tax=Fibrobacter intestinalis TaxID=28122 RepID=UPI003F06D90E
MDNFISRLIAAIAKIVLLFQNPVGNIQMVIQDSIFANPGERGHGGLIYKKVKLSVLTLTLNKKNPSLSPQKKAWNHPTCAQEALVNRHTTSTNIPRPNRDVSVRLIPRMPLKNLPDFPVRE